MNITDFTSKQTSFRLLNYELSNYFFTMQTSISYCKLSQGGQNSGKHFYNLYVYVMILI